MKAPTDAERRDDQRAVVEERLRVLGDLFVRGWHTAADVAAVLALDPAVMRRAASVRDFALFVKVRNARPRNGRLE